MRTLKGVQAAKASVGLSPRNEDEERELETQAQAEDECHALSWRREGQALGSGHSSCFSQTRMTSAAWEKELNYGALTSVSSPLREEASRALWLFQAPPGTHFLCPILIVTRWLLCPRHHPRVPGRKRRLRQKALPAPSVPL